MTILVFAFLGFFCGFVCSFGVDGVTMLIRANAAQRNKFASGTLSVQKIMLINRIGAAIMFMSIGLIVDVGISITAVTLLISVSFIFLGVFFILKFLHVESSLKSGQISGVCQNNSHKLLIGYPYIFNCLGLALPVTSAILYPDFRATLIQSGFLLNSIATLLNVYIIEGRFIGLIEDKKNDEAMLYAAMIGISRGVILIVNGLLLGFSGWIMIF